MRSVWGYEIPPGMIIIEEERHERDLRMGRGPWNAEPDYVRFEYAEGGGVVIRKPEGHWKLLLRLSPSGSVWTYYAKEFGAPEFCTPLDQSTLHLGYADLGAVLREVPSMLGDLSRMSR